MKNKLEKTKDKELYLGDPMDRGFDLESTIPNEFKTFLTGEINIDVATKVAEDLYNFNDVNTKISKPRNIKLIINTPGGDLHAAQMICDIIEEIDTPVHTYAFGQACSAGFLIFMHGARGHRYSSRNTQFMSHTYSMVLEGSYNDITKHRKSEFMRMHERLITQYATHTGLTKKEVEEKLLTHHDVWLTAEECKKLNIVDIILGESHGRKKSKNSK